MSITPPAGYGTYAVTFSYTGSTKKMVNTWGFRNVSATTALACAVSLNNAFRSAGRIYDPALYTSSFKLEEVYTLINGGGTLFSDTAFPGTVGTSTFAPPAPNVSLVVGKRTPNAGRQYRGRIALPSGFIDEADIDQDGLIGASLPFYQTALNATLANANSNNVPLYLLHGPNKLGITPVPTQITSLHADPLVGTQRKRLGRWAGEPAPVALIPPYSVTFTSGRLPINSGITYTVPAGRVALISCVTFVQDVPTVAGSAYAYHDQTGSGLAPVLFTSFNWVAGTGSNRLSTTWIGHIVVPAGGKMGAQTNSPGQAWITMSGYLLTVWAAPVGAEL